MKVLSVYTASVLVLVSVLGSCGEKPAFREYTEVTTQSQFGQFGTGSPGSGGVVSSQEIDLFNQITSSIPLSSGITWSTPKAWTEVKETGVRLVSFKTRSSLEVTLVAFPGQVGGVRANLSRWLGQAGITLNETELNEFIQGLSVGKNRDESLSYILVDFETLPAKVKKNSSQNLLAAIYGFSDQMLFVKLLGPKKDIKTDREEFLQFLKTIQPKSV